MPPLDANPDPRSAPSVPGTTILNAPSAPVSGTKPVAPAAVRSAPTVVGSAPAKAKQRPAPAVPTQVGPRGIRFDFNAGARVRLPKGEWRVRLSDLDTGNILYETTTKGGSIATAKRYYLRARIEVWAGDEKVLTHDYNSTDREVLIQFPVGTLGDPIGWLPYAVRFQQQHRCRLTCAMAEWLIPLFAPAYPDIVFATSDTIDPERFYATYNLGLFFDDTGFVRQPCDFRLVGLHRTAGYILGVDPEEEPPKLVLPDESRPIPEPYVCIGVQSTTQAKYWNNPNGWRDVVKFLRESGYRVICIDAKPAHGHGLVWTQIPNGAEDETGRRPLVERARWLRHATCFVGLSSGLSWLAWAAGTPVVMISGFTHPCNEFATPYRIVNYHACNGCWHDPSVRFIHTDFLWCPRHAGTPRQFECTRLIAASQVNRAIARVPGFGARTVTKDEIHVG